MAKRAPGKHYRKGLSLMEAVDLFKDEAKSEAWFVERRWPNGVQCPRCEGEDVKARKGERKVHRTRVYHCNGCKFDFTIKVGTIMEGSKLPLSKWGLAFYLYSTHLKGVSSMKLHRDLGVTQKTAWHLAHRIREAWTDQAEKFSGPVEVDETYFGGKEKNKHESKKFHAGTGAVGKTVVAGVKNRPTNEVQAEIVGTTDRSTLQGFVLRNTQPDAMVCTDEARAYDGLNRRREAVRHGVGDYVRGMAHTNGMESFWALMKCGYHGTYHHFSKKHLGRYINEFAGRHNIRPMDTADQMARLVKRSVGKRLRYEDLIGPMETRNPRML